MVAAPVTLLFTDLAHSTELLHRVGDQRAHRILRTHRQLLQDAVAVHGGQEVKWLGDGLMTIFPSVADAVRCAITMQQQARRPAAGERLGLRIGLHVGEALPDEGDYVGTPVVLARRLCEQATAGQILCSGLVADLLRGRQAFHFADVGALALKGFPDPVLGYEVAYEPEEAVARLGQTPFTGRTAELARLTHRLEDARGARGGVVMVMGEPGIGKTRMLEEFAERVRAQGTLVLWGRCYEGEAGRPYGPFAEAIGEYARTAATETLAADLGPGAAPLGRLVPGVRARLLDLPEPAPLEPYEERVRLLDAVTQFLLALAARVPTVLVLDDLHWADAGTVALLRHVARFAPRGRLMVLGAYRDVDVDRQHPLAEALGTLPRETRYEHVGLAGLDQPAVQALLDAIAEAEVEPGLVETVARETSGNPFFIREVLLHLLEEGALARDGKQWRAALPGGVQAVPETVRQVIERRLGRVSAAARQLLRVAAAFTAGVPFEVARRVAGLEEAGALDALDEVLAAQLLKPTADRDRFDFTHALVRHTLYDAQSPPRQVRLHRQIAEAMEAVYGERASEHAAEIARQYHQSAALPGAERGVAYCLAAAERAERATALEEVADALAMALALLPPDDERRGRLLAHRSLALGATKRADEAAAIAIEAAELIAGSDGHAAAASYLAEVAGSIFMAGTAAAAWAVARHGLTFAKDRRDWAWAVLRAHDLDRVDAEDPDHPGIVVDTPERREIAQFSPAFARNQDMMQGSRALWWARWEIFESRQAALETAGPYARNAHISWAGAYRDALPLAERLAHAALEQGELARAAQDVAVCSRLHAALGDLASAERDLMRVATLAKRAGNPPMVVTQRNTALFDVAYARGTGLDLGASVADAALARDDPAVRWARAPVHSLAAVLYTFAGRDEDALRAVACAVPAIERAGGGVAGYTQMICRCCRALWRLGRADFAGVLERNLRAKTLPGDLRDLGVDARVAMAQLCALTGRPDEAHEWFERARAVLDEQGARPLRALVDLDEAWMEVRRGPHGDRDRARALLDVACEQFQAIGMPGWIERAEALRASVGSAAIAVPAPAVPLVPKSDHADAVHANPALLDRSLRTAHDLEMPSLPGKANVFRKEGDYWTIAYEDVVFRLKDTKGLHYIAHLLRHPATEFHANDLVAAAGPRAGAPSNAERGPSRQELAAEGLVVSRLGGAPALLDARAKAAYQERLSDLREELANAERLHDLGRAEHAGAEIDFLTTELTAPFRGHQKANPYAERARLTVTKGIKAALERISQNHPALGRHLAVTIRRGTFCAYTPDPRHPIPWTF